MRRIIICRTRRRRRLPCAIQRALVILLLSLFTIAFNYRVVVVVVEGHVDGKPHCDEIWTCFNGNMAGPVNDTSSCEDACRSCEGGDFRCPDLKASTTQTIFVVEGGDETKNVTVSSYQCQCFQVDASSSSCGSGSDRRTICTDEDFKADEATKPSSSTQKFAAMFVVETFFVVSSLISFAVV